MFMYVLTLVPSTGVFQRRLLLPPAQNEIRPLLQHTSGELLLTDARATARKFECAAANPRYLLTRGSCKLPCLEISAPLRIVIQVFAFHLTSSGKFVS